MATGKSTQLTRQIGEHLVCAELGRRGLFATPFAGNVPDFDLVVADHLGNSILVQVKAINQTSWQFGAASFLNIELASNVQSIIGLKALPNPGLICVFVVLKEDRQDEFYILTLGELQQIIRVKYAEYLGKKAGVRPKNPKSLHCAVWVKELASFKDKWTTISECFPTS